ncbi:50S ribosomal protein L10 [Methanobacterium alkalithermotolerans]|uniref:Large ribosomal subunit protein uL10 n=1 Tax=Methanobacterium alkalithermotolerans TaxID=2731220 RepID=A0A8T8K510_9EURY|nr:50S ribosomal protein L10 [Methanobacterium alkalithermotolerans]QUH23666.1 50S ribosomal protein L10 [Methanobacterium alkalithermotolerans]RJS49779.1 MAG: 50S ribosomal protein L10 [Methanobacterium sp.]
MAHVAEWKKEEVKDLKELINGYEVVGIANLSDIPARQLQKMRQNLRDKATIRMSKKTLISLALDDSNNKKDNINILSNHMDGQPALIFTDMNPFKLFKILEDSKTAAPAKAGAVPSEDIVVPKGDTGFPPGPILGELQQIGIPAKIDKGKIVVQKDQVVVKAGEEVSAKVAGILTRLDIQPMEVGIDLKAAYENETVYTADLLTIDEEQTLSDIQRAFAQAFNLSVNAVIFTKESMPAIIQNAATKSLNLAFNASVLTSKTTEMLLSKAYSQMLAVAAEASGKDSDAVDEELLEKLASTATSAPEAEEKKEEKPDEEEEEEEQEEDAAAGLGALFG